MQGLGLGSPKDALILQQGTNKETPEQPLRRDKQRCTSPPLHVESLLTSKCHYRKCRDALTPCGSRMSGVQRPQA